MSQAVNQKLTEQIIKYLEEGTIPWRRGWTQANAPKNMKTGKAYRGSNIWLLCGSKWWASAKQAKEMGGSIKPEELQNYTVGSYWNSREIEDENAPDGKKVIRFGLYFKTYRIDQMELPAEVLEKYTKVDDVLDFNPIESAETIVRQMPDRPEIRHSSESRAYYDIISDHVHMPNRETFDNELRYYEVLFHELTHSTGAEKRLGRNLEGKAAAHRQSYSKEELIAEMGAAMLCSEAGIIERSTVENSASYIASWLQALRNDNKLVLVAAGKAQKAVDFILGN